jgi:hypothetical protein
MSHKKSAKNVTPDAELAAWCAALATPDTPDEVPPGWFTAAQLSEKVGMSYDWAGRRVGALVKAGKVEVKKFRIPSGQRGIYPVAHYRLK